MKRSRQKNDEGDSEPSSGRGKRVRKPTEKFKDLKSSATSNTQNLSNKKIKVSTRKYLDDFEKGGHSDNLEELETSETQISAIEFEDKNGSQTSSGQHESVKLDTTSASLLSYVPVETSGKGKTVEMNSSSTENGPHVSSVGLDLGLSSSGSEETPESKWQTSNLSKNGRIEPFLKTDTTLSSIIPKSHPTTEADIEESTISEENASVVTSSERICDDNPSSVEETLDMEETYITIETNNGLSSQKIPMSQFLQKVVLDKASGNVKLDLGTLLSVNNKNKSEEVNASVSRSSTSTTLKMAAARKNASAVKRSLTQQVLVSSSTSIPTKPVKRRGRPPKNKPAQTTEEDRCSTLLSKNCARTDQHSSVGLMSEKQDFNRSPRRSSRTPAKNSRFAEDYVDSITLGKVATPSSSSTWNTQLMTLALAAERHKSKPHKSSTTETEGSSRDESVGAYNVYDEDIDYKEVFVKNNGTVDVSKKESIGTVDQEQKRYISIRNFDPKIRNVEVTDEKRKRVGIRGPVVKRYEPVDPVVKRTLEEALTHATETTKDLLSVMTPEMKDNENGNDTVYYTIMEPKMPASGHGLLIKKSEEGVSFGIANFNGNLPSSSGLSKFSKMYPQDRYFMCNLCDGIYPSTSSWLQHNKDVHNRTMDAFENSPSNSCDRIEYTCQFCGQKFPHKYMLDIHIRRKRHNEVKTFRCTLCKETLSSHKAREEHWMMAHPARSCGLCGKQFTNIVMLRRHINNNCHGARFRKRPGSNEINAEEIMVVAPGETSSPGKESKQISGKEDDETLKETDVDDGDEEDECDNDFDDENEGELLFANQEKQDNRKVKCETCGTEFSTHAGLWHHKLDLHQEYYPKGFKDRLQEKLDKNENMLLNAHDGDIPIPKQMEGNRNKFFVIMRPKWPSHKPKLAISAEEKEFVFKPCDEKIECKKSLPLNSYDDAPSLKDTSFECSQCGESFRFASNYREHRSRVHSECFEVLRLLGAFQCTLCTETYPCQFMLDKHLKKHVGKKLLPCTLCGLFFHKIQERRLHWKMAHPGIGCPNCGKMYASIKYLQKHISLNCQDHFPPTKKFLEFQKKQHSDFEMAKNEKKVEKKIIKCHLCPKLCSSVHGWRRHMSEAHEDAGFSKLSNTCIICNELVYGYKALEKHLLQNHAEESGLPVEEEDSLVEEALKKSEVDIMSYRKAGREDQDIFQDEEGYYHCPSCPKTHTDIRALRTHIKIHVNMKLECSVCQKTFKNPTLLKQHVQRHRKKAVYNCDTCNKKFLTLQKLNKHRKVHHSTGSFVCELCGISFALNDYLQKHKRCHSDKRPHSCTVCGKSFRTKPELRVHILIHTRETPYKCQYCNRGFSQKGNYRIHLAQHTGEKPYQCDQCEISFALPCHLERHKVTHNQMINYRCIWCDKECTQRKHMQMHVQRVHKEDFYQFEEQMKLATPIPIAASQVKLYNRRLGKMNKVRKQYRTRAQKCDSTIQQLMTGVVTKPEPMDGDPDSSQNIVIEPIVEPMMDVTVCEMPEGVHENGGYEILVSDDSQNPVKSATCIPADLIGQDASNVEIVMGENNEINIIIKDPSALQEVVNGQTNLNQLSGGSVEIQESLQQAVEALVSHANIAKGIGEEESAETVTLCDDTLGKSAVVTDVQILDHYATTD